MRCDDAFDILTAGAFPSGAATDAAVERHLESCHECRRFAEALQPNLSDDRGFDLPCYQGKFAQAANEASTIDLSNQIQKIILNENAQRDCDANVSRQPRRWLSARLAAACCIACLLGAAAALGGPGLARGLAKNYRSQEGLASPPIQMAFRGVSCDGDAVPSLKEGDIVLPVSLRESKEACCLTCHGGSPSKQSSRATIGLVVMSCQKCHEEKSRSVRM
jgi:hypothetical protein